MKTPGYDAKSAALKIQQRLGGDMRPNNRGGYMVRCPAHDDHGPSLSIRPVADGEIAVHCFGGCDSSSLVKAVLAELGVGGKELAESINQDNGTPSTVPKILRYDARAQLPKGFRVKPDALDHHLHGRPSKVWTYHLPNKAIACFVARYDTPTGKEFGPFSWAFDRKFNRERLAMCAPSPRPLYNLHKIMARPDVPILWTEGEKAADAAEHLFPEWATTTNMNGVNSIDLTDFSPCAGRVFIMSPDEDGPGYGAANSAGRRAAEAGASNIYILMPPCGFNVVDGQLSEGEYKLFDGDDAADHRARGWTGPLWREAAERSGMPMLRRLILPELPKVENGQQQAA